MKTKYVEIERLTDISVDEFAPYGQIIGLEDSPPLEDFPHLNYWTHNVDIGPDEEKLDLGLLLCKPLPPGTAITKMERHPYTWEIFMPPVGEVVFVMAPIDTQGDAPDIARVRAFLLDGGLGVALPGGNWHWPPIPVGGPAKISLLRKGPRLDKADFAELGVQIKLIF
jgi:ureidoglycolate lyase